MSTLPIIIIAAVSGWGVIATGLAILWGRNLRRERDDHEQAQERIASFRSAVVRLKEQAAALNEQFAALQKEHAELRQAYDAQREAAEDAAEPKPEPALPMVMIDTLDLSSEIGALFEHVARVASTVRNYSAYTRGHNAPEQAKARYDLLWLADCLHNFDEIGRALSRGSVQALSSACEDTGAMYDKYLKDASGYNSRDTFQRLSDNVPLDPPSEAFRSIIAKTGPAARTRASREPLLEPDRFMPTARSSRGLAEAR